LPGEEDVLTHFSSHGRKHFCFAPHQLYPPSKTHPCSSKPLHFVPFHRDPGGQAMDAALEESHGSSHKRKHFIFEAHQE
jgi:hypothetical protein